MAFSKGAARLVSGVVQDMIRQEQEAKRREEARKQDIEDSHRRIRETLAVERYKSRVSQYENNHALADKLEASSGAGAFAQLYYSGLVGLPVTSESRNLDPSTPTGAKNLEWFQQEENRKAVISYLRGGQKPSFTLDLNDPEFEDYRSSRREAKDNLAKNMRRSTGNPIHTIPETRGAEEHQQLIDQMAPKSRQSSMAKQFEQLGIAPPSFEMAGKQPQRITPIIYYGPDGEAVRAFSMEEAKDLESKGYSAAAPTASGSKLPVTLYNKETGESRDLRPSDPMVDELIKTQKWTREKPQRPTRVRNIMPSEAKQIDNFIESFSRSDSKAFSEFKSAWEEADKGKERNQITGTIYSRISELRAMPEYQDEGLEFLTNIAIQDIIPRIELKDWTGLGGIATDVIVRPAGDEVPVDGDEAPTDNIVEPPQDEKPPVPQVKLGLNEKLAYYQPSKRYVVVDVTTNKTLRWAE